MERVNQNYKLEEKIVWDTEGLKATSVRSNHYNKDRKMHGTFYSIDNV